MSASHQSPVPGHSGHVIPLSTVSWPAMYSSQHQPAAARPGLSPPQDSEHEMTASLPMTGPALQGEPQPDPSRKVWEKPPFYLSCLIALALKNSESESLLLSEIYNFISTHFPFFKQDKGCPNKIDTTLQRCFQKVVDPQGIVRKKGNYWQLNPDKKNKIWEKINESLDIYRNSIKRCM